MAKEKVWTYDKLITRYIIEKTKRGYEPNCTSEEIIDFLNFITQYVKVSENDTQYNGVIENYLNGIGSKKADWNISKGDFVYIPVVEQLESGLIVPTYDLTYVPPKYSDFDSDKKTYDENFSNYLTEYIEKNCSKRKINLDNLPDDDTIYFSEVAAANLLMHIWDKEKYRYKKDGKWPIQCNDIKKYLLDKDLASIIGLPAWREKLIEFYFTISERIKCVAQQSSNFRMTNFEEEVLAKSNFDLVMNGYTDISYYLRTVNSEQEAVMIDRGKNEIKTIIDRYEGNIERKELDNPKVLKLVTDLKKTLQK